jgi:uncharacterized protein (TIGR00369 family)
MSLLPVYQKSFFTGGERADGLQLKLRHRRGLVYADMIVGNAFQGYENVVHGGILFGILDTIMWYAIIMATKKICMTRKTDTDFFKPVVCGAPYRAEGRLLRVEGRDVWATAWIEDADKERYAQVTALFREPKRLDRERLLSRLDFTGVSPETRAYFMSTTP